VKNNQPGLRRKLELGSATRTPRGGARSKTKGRNRFETRELKVFDAKAWFRRTPWETFIKTVLRLERTIQRRNAATGLWTRTCETVYWVSSASGATPERWNEWIRAHWRIENGSHYVRDATFAEDASRIRKNPDIVARMRSFAYNLLRTESCENIKNPRWRAALHMDQLLKISGLY
jgi:predicted transposase YbfD/YdcC